MIIFGYKFVRQETIWTHGRRRAFSFDIGLRGYGHIQRCLAVLWTLPSLVPGLSMQVLDTIFPQYIVLSRDVLGVVLPKMTCANTWYRHMMIFASKLVVSGCAQSLGSWVMMARRCQGVVGMRARLL